MCSSLNNTAVAYTHSYLTLVRPKDNPNVLWFVTGICLWDVQYSVSSLCVKGSHSGSLNVKKVDP